MEYGCIGERLGHSFSAQIHSLLADYRYELCEVEPARLGEFMMERRFRGINVTIPYKEQVIPYLDWIDDAAKRIGAVNTVVNRDGRLYGYNTDFYGMKSLIEYMGMDLRGKRVAVLGTGGTSRTARAVAEYLGALEVLTVGRRQKEGAIDYATLQREHADVEVLINTTPCGMYPYPNGNENTPAAAVNVADFPNLCGVADAVYNPLRPRLILDASEGGIRAEAGLYMLVAQAVRACEIFLDTAFEAGKVECVWKQILREKQNLVLIGMPGSGKSTVGSLLASRLGRRFLDTDALIEEKAGKTIPQIFSEDGEAYFRDLEAEVIESVASENGLVIATGGGAILRRENCRALKRNGRLYFLDRPLCDLLPTDDRPLASSADAIKKRYGERYSLYCAVADHRVAVAGDAESVASEIEKEFQS